MITKKILAMMTDKSVKVFDKETQNYRYPFFRDFSILLRRKTHLKHYINAFKAYNIPFYVADTGSLTESLSVKSLLCALNTIEYQDNINLYGALSHLLNVSDDSLTEYVLMGRELISGLTEDADNTGVSKSLVNLSINPQVIGKDRATLSELAERIVEDTEHMLFRSETLEIEICISFGFMPGYDHKAIL